LLGLSVIAEGIEDRATADLLGSKGCEEGQGYYFGRPMPAAEFEQRFLVNDARLISGIYEGPQIVTAA
jgi:EAL domain-containing protein (putative c-di-GMP-specific phosphodiesterase class I)